MFRVYTDGSYNEETKTAYAGYVIVSEHNRIAYRYGAKANAKTSSEAEQLAIILALRRIKKMKLTNVTLHSDNLINIRILNGACLKKSYRTMRKLAKDIPQLTCRWISRKENKYADALCHYARKFGKINGQGGTFSQDDYIFVKTGKIHKKVS